MLITSERHNCIATSYFIGLDYLGSFDSPIFIDSRHRTPSRCNGGQSTFLSGRPVAQSHNLLLYQYSGNGAVKMED